MSIRCSVKPKQYQIKRGFTIVELLVVIVVIGILAAITIVSYAGISSKATAASLQSDLSGAKTKLQMYQVEYGAFPAALAETPAGSNNYCPNPDLSSGKYCFKASPGNTFLNGAVPAYSSTAPYNTFSLDVANTTSTTKYRITESTGPVVYVAPPAGPETVTIGAQVWMKYNMNVGTIVNGGVAQTLAQKWCYDNLESNCTTYGALYQWNTAMQGSTTEGAQGICPDGFHVPTDGDFKALETFLGVASAELNRFGATTTAQGAYLKVGGYTGFDALLSGVNNGSFLGINQVTLFITSSLYMNVSGGVFYRQISLADTIYRFAMDVNWGYSVRCIKN